MDHVGVYIFLAIVEKSSQTLWKNLNIKIYKTVILPMILHGCETCMISYIKPGIQAKSI